jgi:hypothetical protein
MMMMMMIFLVLIGGCMLGCIIGVIASDGKCGVATAKRVASGE